MAIALLVATWTDAAAAAPTSPLFADFLRNCVAHVGDAPASLNAVSLQGWKPVPPDKLPAVSYPLLKLDWMHGFIGAQPGRSLGLLAGRAEFAGDASHAPIPVAFCVAIQKPMDPLALQQAGSWTMADKLAGGQNIAIYIFDEANGRRSPMAGATMDQLRHDFELGSGRELLTLVDPAQNSEAIAIVAPLSEEARRALALERASPQAASACAPPNGHCPSIVTSVEWSSVPSANAAWAAYPPAAKAAKIAGHVLLLCIVGGDGRLHECSIKAESPADQDFGDAAMQLSKQFVASPTTKAGTPTAGARVTLPLNFQP